MVEPGFFLRKVVKVRATFLGCGNLLWKIWQLSLENLAIFMVTLATFLGYRQRYPFPRYIAKSIVEIITNIHHFAKEGCSEFPPLFANSPIFPTKDCQFHHEGASKYLSWRYNAYRGPIPENYNRPE